jgi:hypothetical protein
MFEVHVKGKRVSGDNLVVSYVVQGQDGHHITDANFIVPMTTEAGQEASLLFTGAGHWAFESCNEHDFVRDVEAAITQHFVDHVQELLPTIH